MTTREQYNLTYATFFVAIVCTNTMAAPEPRDQVVQIHVTGQWESNNAIVEKVGTGFFVSDGFILTAAHVVGPKRETSDVGVQWKRPPDVSLRYVDSNGKKEIVSAEFCSVLYIDEQVDLALIGTDPLQGKNGIPLSNLRQFPSGQHIEIIAYGQARQSPTIVPGGSVDAPFNFGRDHRGFIDINVPGLAETDSGSPIIVDGVVIGIFTQGRKYSQLGDVAAPISFAAPLLAMAGIDYPQLPLRARLTQDEEASIDEVEQLLNELKRDIVSYQIWYRGGLLMVNYQKRLASGWDPSSIRLQIRPRFGDDTLPGFTLSVFPAKSENKDGGAVIDNLAESVQEYLQRQNQQALNLDRRQYDFKDLKTIVVIPTPEWDAGPALAGDEAIVSIK